MRFLGSFEGGFISGQIKDKIVNISYGCTSTFVTDLVSSLLVKEVGSILKVDIIQGSWVVISTC